MRQITKSLFTFLLLCVAGVVNAANEYVIDQKFTSIDALDGQAFAIVNETDGKAIFGSGAQNLGYDLITTAVNGSGHTGYYFKIETVEGGYLLRLQTPSGEPYSVWGNPGYLNSGAEGGFDGCFLLGLGNQNGTDVKDGAVWEIEFDAEQGFALKNKARGGYFAGVNPAPVGTDPIYWTFCTLKAGEELPDPEPDPEPDAPILAGELIPDFFSICDEGGIPYGYVLNFSGEVRQYPTTYGGGPRMFNFADGGDFTKGLYFREGYVEYGTVKKLALEANKKYVVYFNTAMWKSSGAQCTFEIFNENDLETAVLAETIDNAPNMNGSKDAVSGSTKSEIEFTPKAAGNYILKWSVPGFNEVLLANVGVKGCNQTVTFVNDAQWEKVNVYAWSNIGGSDVLLAGEWPGTELTANDEGNFVWTTPYNPTMIIFNNGNNGSQTADLDFVDGAIYNSTGRVIQINDYTATFTTNALWENVYAYAWSGEGESTTKFLGDWPGTKLEAVDGVYTVTIQAEAAPGFIIFNNGNNGQQTADLPFVDGQAYEYNLPMEIVNAAFDPEADPIGWEAVVSGGYRDYGMYQIGGEKLVRFAAPTADETHLNSEFAAGFECRWASNYASYTQRVVLPAGEYALMFDVENVNAATASAPYVNRFFVQVGETTYMDENTEWMNAKSAWTTHTIRFALTEESVVTFSLGYGTGENNISADQTPALYVSHLVLTDPTTADQIALAEAIANLQEVIAAANALKTEERTAGLDEFNAAIATAEEALTATEIETVNAAIESLQAAMETFEAVNYLQVAVAELQEAIAAANALKTDYRTAGLDDFNAAIATAEEALEATELEAVNAAKADLTAAMAAFKKANYFIDFEAGEYYIIDAESGLFMAAGHSWGTQGIVNEMGLDLILTPYEEPRSVTIDSRVSNGGNNHFLGSNLFMDSSEWGWFLEYQGFGFYITNGEQYINIDNNNNLVMSDTPREWIIVSKEGVMAERMDEMAGATAENPVDVTFLLQNPNLNRNDQRNSAWQTSNITFGPQDNNNVNGNYNAECYHKTFSLSQTIEGVPAGVYMLTAQGFYRQDNEVEEDAPVFFINGATATVPVRTGSENSMETAAQSFSEGLYTIEPIVIKVYEAGNLTIGVRGNGTNQWVIFDNFQLTYCGPVEIESYTVAGSFTGIEDGAAEEALFFGELWNPAAAANDMVLGENNLYTKTYENVALSAGTILYKVVADHSWDAPNWGFDGGNADYVVNEAGVYNITFTFNPAEGTVACELELNEIATGISNVNANAQKGQMYNLNGQQVMKAQKGLYIQNGKKVILK